MHGGKEDPIYKTHNPFADPKEKRSLFFVSDTPHLVKTTRNCWSHSGYNGTRLMTVRLVLLLYKMQLYMYEFIQVNDKTIEWKHLQELHDKLSSMAVQSSGLTLIPKLKREHLHLTSFSRMRVDLAAQVRFTKA